MSKIVITGGTGFIGSHIAESCAKDVYEVMIMDNLVAYYSPELKKEEYCLYFKKWKCNICSGRCYRSRSSKRVTDKDVEYVFHETAHAGVRIPVVCTELPQLVDIVDGCGLLVPVKDSQALAEGILKVVSDRDLAQKFGRNGRDKVVENYSWEDTVKKTVQLYGELTQEVKL